MSLMIALLFGVWIVGGMLGYAFKNVSLRNVFFVLPPLVSLFIVITIAVTSSSTGLTSMRWAWFSIGHTSIDLVFEFNILTVPLLVLVNAISFLVHLYSLAYMKNDGSKPRFFATLGLFTFSMISLTLSGNLLQLFVFWELVGLCSYLLIGFYRNHPDANRASTKALIINKIGDVGFLIALMMLWTAAGTLNIETLSTSNLSAEWRTLIGTALLVAVLAKSAQFPFHSWLPDAMVGPTPVSALIHSATMVAAGVFLLVRLQFLFTPFTLQLAAILGLATALIGGINAIRETDLKRFLAWSTLSQLGLMVMVVGTGAFHGAFVHLLSHAIFKAGLFLAAGILIQHYHVKSLQDDRALISSRMLKVLVIVLTLSLMGMPLTIGFLSKEIMLGVISSPGFILAFLVMSFLTAFYCSRLLMFIRPIGDSQNEAKSIPWPMFSVVSLLALATLWIFYSASPVTATAINNIFKLETPSTRITLYSLGTIFFGVAAGVGFIRQGKMKSLETSIPFIPYSQWLTALFVRPVLALSQITTRTDVQIDKAIHAIAYLKVAFAHFIAWIDQTIVDGFVHGLAFLAKAFGNLFRRLVTGKIQDYIWWTVIALVVLLIIIIN
jgi:NADH-quinone oxidoreductase subunit L